ncbi:hypothetical protein [Blastomonas sp.]|uniref:hypothetical protein n=1 Tax=Blastomonas sp. TaxID=1909299 RepID=UPI002624E265|nr:hypothetical protein [Blastomonas sp.]MDM7956754.1 hypothetical protein [Blastomonas sp.]
MTIEQHLRACVDRLADLSPAELCDALDPILADDELATTWLADRMADMRQETPRLPAGFSDPVCQSLVILDHARVHLSLAMISAANWNAERTLAKDTQAIVGFADGWTMVRFLVAPQARIERHVLSPTPQGLRAFRKKPVPVRAAQSIRLNNATESLRFVEMGGDVVMLRLLVRDPSVEQAFECDARTGAVLRVREAQSVHGRTRITVSLLRALGRSDAVGVIAQAMASWPPHLRWHGVREALATDSIAGFGLLQTMAEGDPDAQLRALARRTRADLMTRYPQLAA